MADNQTVSTSTGSQGGLIPNINAWLTHPFNANGSALNWIFFLGFVACVSWLWSRVIADIREFGA